LPKIVAFNDWLLSEAQRDARDLQKLETQGRKGTRTKITKP